MVEFTAAVENDDRFLGQQPQRLLDPLLLHNSEILEDASGARADSATEPLTSTARVTA